MLKENCLIYVHNVDAFVEYVRDLLDMYKIVNVACFKLCIMDTAMHIVCDTVIKNYSILFSLLCHYTNKSQL